MPTIRKWRNAVDARIGWSERWTDFQSLWSGGHPRHAARVVCFFFGLTGGIALFQSFLAPASAALMLRGLAVLSFAISAIGWSLPWDRWGARGLGAITPLTSAFLGLALWLGASPVAIADLLILLAVWGGLFLPIGSGFRAAPWILAAYALPLLVRGEMEMLARGAATTLMVSTVVAEVVSRIVQAQLAAKGEAERMATVFRVTSLAARRMKTLELRALIRELVDAPIAIGFDVAAVNWVDRAAGRFVIRASAGYRTDLAGFEQQLGEGLSGRALVRRRLTVSERYADTREHLAGLAQEELEGVAAVPLEAGGEIIAVLVAGTRSKLPSYALDALELLASDAAGALGNALAFEEQSRIAEEHAQRSLTDPLTGLPNRRAAERELAALADGDSVLILDLDHFKSVNDTDGHLAGDALLVQLAAFLGRSLRGDDFAARWGGEEFLVVLRGAHSEGEAIAERLRSGWNALGPRATFSAGLAVHRAGRAAADTLQVADTALYRAKRTGRDRVALARERLAVA